MAVIKQQTLLIDSGKAIGTPYDCKVYIPRMSIYCNPDQILRIRMQNFITWNSFHSVNISNNRIRFVDEDTELNTDITIPEGNYTFYELADKISELYTHVDVAFIKNSNMFSFKFTTNHTIQFLNKSFEILGFYEDDVPFGENFTSTRVIELEPVNSIVIEIDGISTFGNMNLDNSSGECKSSSVLMQIPIYQDPYSPIVYQSTSDSNSVYVHEKDIQCIRFKVRDLSGKELTSMPVWYGSVCIETVDYSSDSKIEKLLYSILEFHRIDFLQRAISTNRI